MSEALEKIENEIVEFSEFEVQLSEFKGKYDDVVYDLTVPEDEKQARSDKLSIGKVIANLDRKHKDLKAPLKTKTDLIDGERKRIKDDLLGVQEKIKSQINQHEDKEKRRIQDHESRLNVINEYGLIPWSDKTLEELQDLIKLVGDVNLDSFEEFAGLAATSKESTLKSLESMLVSREKYDKEQAELEKLRAESAEREQKETEEKLRLEGEERAKREAANAVALELAQSTKEAAKAIQAKEDAERRAKQAEEKAERDALQAVEREQERVEAERIAEELAAKKREANKAHNKKINNAVLDAFVLTGINKTQAKKAVEAIAKGQIPYTTISY